MDHDEIFPPSTTTEKKHTRVRRLWRSIVKELNFYRIHLTFFTVVPLIFSGIFVAVNGQFTITYIDSLFMCVSAMTVTGLATIDLSSLTALQQVFLFVQMCLGSPVAVSWVIVYIRRSFFENELEHIVESKRGSAGPSTTSGTLTSAGVPWHIRIQHILRLKRRNRSSHSSLKIEEGSAENGPTNGRSSKKGGKKLRVDMIRRLVDDRPKLVNPMGWISEAKEERPQDSASDTGKPEVQPLSSSATLEGRSSEDEKRSVHQIIVESPTEESGLNDGSVQDRAKDAEHGKTTRARDIQTSNGRVPHFDQLPVPDRDPQFSPPLLRTRTHDATSRIPQHAATDRFPRTQTVEFDLRHAPGNRGRHLSIDSRHHRVGNAPSVLYSDNDFRQRRSSVASGHTNGHLHRTPTIISTHSRSIPDPIPLRNKDRGFGGFPGPHSLISRVFQIVFPRLQKQLTRTMTMPNSANMGGSTSQYVSFEPTVGRNSEFQLLTAEELEELGGVEYKALNALLWIVGIYHIGIQVIAFLIIGPYISTSRWKDDFLPPALHRPLKAPWFALFQVISSYTNSGMSLVDQSMIPFQKAYPMIFSMVFLILSGNTAFPIFLRFFVWTISKCVPRKARAQGALRFLLDHPRRCFVYLFPSHQTWFLLTIIVMLTFTDWFFFLVLDIGNPEIQNIPLGTRFAIGLLQASAVRAAGFGTIPLSSLAPAVKVLYVTMMYVSVYPIAMSVRSTNVYEEKSLGIYADEYGHELHEPSLEPGGSRTAVWGKYLAWHMRKQLAFDMWWLGLALFLICIIERDNLEDPSSANWFNIFAVLFELVSAYGTVGLSLGVPYANFSFSGALRPLSKLIVCAVMLRGRHRGLPVAIDRAILIPSEFKRVFEEDDAALHRTRTRMSQAECPGGYTHPPTQDNTKKSQSPLNDSN